MKINTPIFYLLFLSSWAFYRSHKSVGRISIQGSSANGGNRKEGARKKKTVGISSLAELSTTRFSTPKLAYTQEKIFCVEKKMFKIVT